eukprot:TRINITY_DN354_c0_g1_i1.p1 TRINITY_DN354_c0_g1~~TRINITY_DN354_c0_g1_i1.p1  ORF type:complete len:299 (+),score=59.38 TRINITY_DN354_c0_g1_i1:136-1032(+)
MSYRSRSPSPRRTERRMSRSPPRYNSSSRGGGGRLHRYGSERDRRDSTTLFVGNLPHHYKEKDLLDIFDRYGRIKKITIGMNKRTGQSGGYAFVEFCDRRDAEDVFEKFSTYVLEGRRLRLDWDIGWDKKQTYYSSNRGGGFARGGGRRYSPRRSPGGYRGRSPYRRSPSPRGGRRSPSPRRRSQSPRGGRSPSPRRGRSPSPRRRSPSPRGVSPGRRSPSPRGSPIRRSPPRRSPRSGSHSPRRVPARSPSPRRVSPTRRSPVGQGLSPSRRDDKSPKRGRSGSPMANPEKRQRVED